MIEQATEELINTLEDLKQATPQYKPYVVLGLKVRSDYLRGLLRTQGGMTDGQAIEHVKGIVVAHYKPGQGEAHA